MAILVFFAAAARARIVSPDFLFNVHRARFFLGARWLWGVRGPSGNCLPVSFESHPESRFVRQDHLLTSHGTPRSLRGKLFRPLREKLEYDTDDLLSDELHQ